MKNYLYILCLVFPLQSQAMEKQKKKDSKPTLPIPKFVPLKYVPTNQDGNGTQEQKVQPDQPEDDKQEKKEKKRGFKLPNLFSDKSSSSSSSSSSNSSIIGKISLLSKASRTSRNSNDEASVGSSPGTPRAGSRPATPKNVRFSGLETIYELPIDPDERAFCVSPELALAAATKITRERAKKNDKAEQGDESNIPYHIGCDDDDDEELKRIAAQAAAAEESIRGVPADATDLASLIALVSSAKISSNNNNSNDESKEYYD